MTDPGAQTFERNIAAALTSQEWGRAATLALRVLGPEILLYLRGVLHDPDLTDDAFSRFSEKMWRSISHFRGDSTFVSWAYRLAWYTTLELKRGLARRRERRFAPGELSNLVQEVRTSTASYLRTDARQRWADLRDSLDPEERSLRLLRIERRLPWREIAAIMADDGTPAAAVALRKRFERLRTKLHRLFQDR